MKKFKTDKEKTFPDSLLAEMPVVPRTDFADRVIEKLAEQEDIIERALKSMPLEPENAFVQKTLEKIKSDCKRLRFRVPALRFIRRFSAIAATIAIGFGIYRFATLQPTNEFSATQLANRINQTVQNDPELYALTQTEEPSLDELLEASKIFATIDPLTLEIFAYND